MQLEIPDGDFEGYIFDCDGTLVDSMPAHYLAWKNTLKEFNAGFEFPEDLFYSLGGIATTKIVLLLNEKFKTSLDPIAIAQRKEENYVQNLDHITVIEPVANLARALGRTHPVSVASGGYKHVIARTLELAGLDGLFPVVVTAEDVEHGKPAPDMFLLAARLMNVSPEKCLVFEDGEAGIQGALKAGMKTVFIPLQH